MYSRVHTPMFKDIHVHARLPKRDIIDVARVCDGERCGKKVERKRQQKVAAPPLFALVNMTRRARTPVRSRQR